MNVIVDTSVWSLALRRARFVETPDVAELRHLIGTGRVVMLGPIRQELLSGVRIAEEFKRLRVTLQPFVDVPLVTEDYEAAATCFNRCRARGIQGSNTDFLICAVSDRTGWPVFTTDKDFGQFAKVLSLRLHTRAARR